MTQLKYTKEQVAEALKKSVMEGFSRHALAISFQAPDFYLKFGFVLDCIRPGYTAEFLTFKGIFFASRLIKF